MGGSSDVGRLDVPSSSEDIDQPRWRQLASFYDAESGARSARPIDPRRVELRSAFVRLMAAEGRTRMIDVGSGPGRDAASFAADGLDVTCVDLSPVNVATCRALGLTAHAASVTELPFTDQAFEAGWTMSTLIHLDDSDFDRSLREMRRVLVRGAPLAIGAWLAESHPSGVSPPSVASSSSRFFHFRTAEEMASVLAPFGELEQGETWAPNADPDRRYRWWLLRLK